MRRLVAIVLCLWGALLSCGTVAADLAEGRDFKLLNPPLAAERHKVEVTEFFWYGCPHCFNLDPLAIAWAQRLPPDVSFRRVPAAFADGKWVSGARLYYALEAMNLLERMHPEVFKAIHVERKRLDKEDALAAWVAGKGIKPEDFLAAWRSFGVQSRVRQAVELTRRAGITGVPAMVVDGRYQAITPATNVELLGLVDRLIERARAERGQK